MIFTLSAELIKHQASILKEFLNAGGKEISHSSCLQVVSKMYGFANWNTLKAQLDNKG